MVRKSLRRVLRALLFWLSRWALKKHDPTVIAITGEGKTAIAREAVYSALKAKFPVRRNLETPNAEFVLPLTILGTQSYPTSYWEWVVTLGKLVGQLLLLPKHKNFLVLEIGYTRKETFDYFWDITKPQVLVICGKTPYLSPNQKAPHTIKVEETEDLSGYIKAAKRVASLFDIEEKEAEERLQNLQLPKAKIRVLPTKDGGLLVDATHQYFPPQEGALEEILEALPGKKIVITPQSKKIPQKVKNGEVAAVVGQARKMWPTLQKLTNNPWI